MSTFQKMIDQAEAEQVHAAKLKAEQSMIFSYNRVGTWGRTPDPIQWPEDSTLEFATRSKFGYSGDGDIYPHGSSDIGWHYQVWEGGDGSFIVSVSTYDRGHDIYTRELPDFLALIAHLESTLCALVYPKVADDA